jgi:hypothetical protein
MGIHKRKKPYKRAKPLGRPDGVYLPNHEQLVKLICMRGAKDEEIEMVYGLGPGTIQKWREYYPGLDKAIEQGRTVADGQVLFSLFKTANGFHEYEEQAVGGKTPRVLKVKRYYRPEFLAQKHWLASRKKEDWPAMERREFSGPNGNPMKVESRNDVIEAILGLVTPKKDPEKEKPQKEPKA